MKPYKALGYVVVDRHPGTRSLIFEHQRVAEQILGRKLRPKEVVHHIDHNRSNNDPSNLMILKDQTSHILEHSSTKMKKLIIHPDGVREWIRIPHVCKICGKEFYGQRDEAKFCSAVCDGLSKVCREEHKCPQCKKIFLRVPTSDQDYCSYECYSKSRHAWITDRCLACGKPFQRTKSSRQRYCCMDHSPQHIEGMPEKFVVVSLLTRLSVNKAAEELGVTPSEMSHYRQAYAIPMKFHRFYRGKEN